VDYAKIAEGYGAVGYTAPLAELEIAVEDAKRIADSPVLSTSRCCQSMTGGYGAGGVGTPSTAKTPRCREAWQDHLSHVPGRAPILTKKEGQVWTKAQIGVFARAGSEAARGETSSTASKCGSRGISDVYLPSRRSWPQSWR
jgi:hypothetical protein